MKKVLVLLLAIIMAILNRDLSRIGQEATVKSQAAYSFTEEEKELMAKVLWNEAGAASYKCKLYCASVMVNQLDAGYWGDTITEVLSRKGGYVGYDYLERAEGQDLTECYKVIEEICKSGTQLPSYVWYFATSKFQWEHIQIYTEVDGVKFQYFPAEWRAKGWH